MISRTILPLLEAIGSKTGENVRRLFSLFGPVKESGRGLPYSKTLARWRCTLKKSQVVGSNDWLENVQNEIKLHQGRCSYEEQEQPQGPIPYVNPRLGNKRTIDAKLVGKKPQQPHTPRQFCTMLRASMGKRHCVGTGSLHLPSGPQNALAIQEHIDGGRGPEKARNEPGLNIHFAALPGDQFTHIGRPVSFTARSESIC